MIYFVMMQKKTYFMRISFDVIIFFFFKSLFFYIRYIILTFTEFDAYTCKYNDKCYHSYDDQNNSPIFFLLPAKIVYIAHVLHVCHKSISYNKYRICITHLLAD